MNYFVILTTLFFVASFGNLAAGLPTCDTVCKMKTDITAMFNKTKPLQGAALRLGFHDCVDSCDGCIRLNGFDSNKGLEGIFDAANKLYKEGKYEGVSRADFWALTSIVAVEVGIQLSNSERTDGKKCPEFKITEEWGRLDNNHETCNDQTNEMFPNPKMNFTSMMTYFKNQMNFTHDEVVAIMGAHSLGGASASGWQGTFTGNDTSKTQNHFDENYYAQMVDPKFKWTNVDVNENNFQFNGYVNEKQEGMMFNTDFEMFYDLTLDATTAETTCTLNHTCGVTGSCTDNCPKASTFDTSMKYSKDCVLFVQDFGKAMVKMLQHNVKGTLESLDCDCSATPTTGPTASTTEPTTSTTEPTTSSSPSLAKLTFSALASSIIAIFL